MIIAIALNSFLAICALAAVVGQRFRINTLEERIAALEKKTKDIVASE